MDPEIIKTYGNRLRIRVCGICQDGESLLMVKHKMHANGNFWAPPGGGVEFGQTASESLIREFKEETGLLIRTGNLRFICELVKPPLHAIELFFEVYKNGGELLKGFDPEMSPEDQIIEDVRFMTFTEIMMLSKLRRFAEMMMWRMTESRF